MIDRVRLPRVARRRWWLVALLAVLALGGFVAAAAAYQGSRGGVDARRGRIVSAVEQPLRRVGPSSISELTLNSSTGLAVHARVRAAPAGARRRPAAVLLGGAGRGSRIVDAPGIEILEDDALIVAPDYPVRLSPQAWRGTAAVSTLLGLRGAALNAVAGVLLLVDYLESRTDVDPRRIFLVGGSLGAEVVVIAGALDPRPAAVVALYGAANVGPLIAHTLTHPAQRHPYSRWSATAAGYGLSLLLTPLEPRRYAGGIAPRPFLMVNGADDSLVPREYVLALYDAAGEPKTLVWVPGEHIQPEETALIVGSVGIVRAWLIEHHLR